MASKPLTIDSTAENVPMEKTDEDERRNEAVEISEEDKAGLISTWLMLHLTPLLKIGATKHLYQEDCGIPSKIDSAEHATDTILKSWGKELDRCAEFNERLDQMEQEEIQKHGELKKRRKRKSPNLNWAILEAYGPAEFYMSLFYYFISTFCLFAPVLLLEDLVQYFEAIEAGDTGHNCFVNPWIEVVGLGVFPIIVGILQTKSQVTMVHFATFVRTAASVLVYQKSLVVSPTAKAMASSGKVFNLMSNDAVQLQKITLWLALGLSCPILVIIALILIYRQIGKATWVGVAVLIVSMPINAALFAIIAVLRRKVLKHSDDRVSMVNELLNGIRIIKFYAWEKPYGKMVTKSRTLELKYITYMAYVVAIGFSITIVSIPIVQPIVVFYSYIRWETTPLTAAKAFSTLTLFAIMRFPFVVLPLGLIAVAQCYIASKRISGYLTLPERKDYIVYEPCPSDNITPTSSHVMEGSVNMENCTFSWTLPEQTKLKETRKFRRTKKKEEESSNPITLKNIRCKINAGELIAVVGKVGSGKSSFLSAILGEMETVDDSKVYIPGGDCDGFLAYCPQTPWVINETIRGNIVFNRTFDEARYNKVLHACALQDDLEALPAGDMTAIGERGINLSGGQKARVALARALYSSNTKLMLLDDPLSAVDGHVGEHLFSEAICGELGDAVTRVLVTHHVQFLPNCDSIIVLEDGEIKHYGKYEELIADGVDFQAAVSVQKDEEENKQKIQDSSYKESKKSSRSVEPSGDFKQESQAHAVTAKKQGETLISDEERDLGSVDLSKYSFYVKAGGIWNAIGFFVSQILGRGAEIGGGFWLAYWSDNVALAEQEGIEMPQEVTAFYLNVYALIGVAGIILLTLRSLFQSSHRLHASTKMHDDMLHQILRAPISFYDITPIGRILNRFSTDLDRIDLGLPMAVLSAGNSAALVLGSIVAIIISTKGAFLIPLVPILYVYFKIQKWFRKTSTELQRLVNISNSPIFADFAQTLSGTSVIRAFRVGDHFFSKTQDSFDTYNVVFVLFNNCTNWLSLRLDVLGGIVQAFIAALALATIRFDFIPAGLLGLSLSFSIEATTFLKQGVRSFSKLEADMSSVERILYYSSDIPEEDPDIIPEKDPDPNLWPNTGCIEFVDVSMRYRDGPLVLKKISASIKGGEKVGIVGRTGSGKSSLMTALFRMVDTESGEIRIDGINIAEIGTDILRQKLSIIPQDPVMFSNTVRHNIDPLHNATDEELWEILGKVELADFVAGLPLGLDEMVMEGGDNFSQGQKQLLCIGRSMLRNARILVMDEATASIDNSTDALIQKTIRENFSEATVLTIAHRLNTIMDSDRVLVLDSGMVAEFDSPANLLTKKSGLFKDFVERNSMRGDD